MHTDGGSRGNPGPGAAGVCILNDAGEVVHEISEYLGVTTNNEAEYQALLLSLRWISEQPDQLEGVIWKLDSKLVVEQVQKRWKIKEPRLQVFAQSCWEIITTLPFPFQITYIPREENRCADALVNQALDLQTA